MEAEAVQICVGLSTPKAREYDLRGGPAQLCDQQRGWGKPKGETRGRLKTNQPTNQPVIDLVLKFPLFLEQQDSFLT